MPIVFTSKWIAHSFFNDKRCCWFFATFMHFMRDFVSSACDSIKKINFTYAVSFHRWNSKNSSCLSWFATIEFRKHWNFNAFLCGCNQPFSLGVFELFMVRENDSSSISISIWNSLFVPKREGNVLQTLLNESKLKNFLRKNGHSTPFQRTLSRLLHDCKSDRRIQKF